MRLGALVVVEAVGLDAVGLAALWRGVAAAVSRAQFGWGFGKHEVEFTSDTDSERGLEEQKR
jgi:hypothetical protein